MKETVSSAKSGMPQAKVPVISRQGVVKPYRLMEYTEGKELKVVLLSMQKSVFKSADGEEREFFAEVQLDEGISAALVGNYVIIQYADRRFRLYCYYGGVLHKGPLCKKYMHIDGHFVFANEEDIWWTARINCEGYTALGSYEGEGIWILQGKIQTQISMYWKKKWVVKRYRDVSSEKLGSSLYYICRKKNGHYDLIIVNHNNYVFLVEGVDNDYLALLKKNPHNPLLTQVAEYQLLGKHEAEVTG